MPYDNTNKGALFKNKKPKNENSPGYNGSLNINGTEYWLNAWLKESKEGEKYFSLTVKPKEEQAPAPEAKPATESDEVPF